jgi:hypothetical protein
LKLLNILAYFVVQFSVVNEMECACSLMYRSHSRIKGGGVEHGITACEGTLIKDIGAYHPSVIKEATETIKHL